jgi:hypothetical protein
MAKSKTKPMNPFAGRWRIISMSAWDEEFIDEEEEGYFELDQKGNGEFHFGYIHGHMDCRLTTRDGVQAVEWTWDGNDEMDPAQGRGSAVVIPRVKGKRREVRRMLARRSQELLSRYRTVESIPETCPLMKALSMATTPKAELLDFLRRSEATFAAKSILRRTFQEFVLEYGWWYEPPEADLNFATGTPQECHKNAADLVLANDSLIYCEGYALFKSGSLPTLHAWVTDGHARAIDNTWPQPGLAYAGVPFKSIFVNMTAL